MKYNILLAALFLYSCGLNQQAKTEANNTVNNCKAYPHSIDSLHLQDLYDSARWYIYTDNCDVLYKLRSDSSTNKTFGELELKFDNVFIRNDTASLFFNFMDGSQPILPSMTRDAKQLSTGIGFDLKSRKKVYALTANITMKSQGDSKSRYENPLQPEVLRYINDNWTKINACFRMLAEGNGLKKGKEF